MKTGQTRIDDSLRYIQKIGKFDLASHLYTTLKSSGLSLSKIDGELSLGSRTDGSKDPGYAANSLKRDAIRALLLCQRTYFNKPWAQIFLIGGAQTEVDLLDKDWKQTSVNYWSARSIGSIDEAIYTFAITTGTVTRLADAATAMPDKSGGTPYLTLRRILSPFPGLTSCYGSVMTWMFKSGLASWRWYVRSSGACNKTSLRAVFGPARTIWAANTPFGDQDTLPDVPRGHIVHLYVDNNERWLGHWLVSNGDGTASGCNNDLEGGTVPNAYCNRCSLDAQFRNGYKHPLVTGGFETGIAEVIDPMSIPNRM
jgi:hypothetical protein